MGDRITRLAFSRQAGSAFALPTLVLAAAVGLSLLAMLYHASCTCATYGCRWHASQHLYSDRSVLWVGTVLYAAAVRPILAGGSPGGGLLVAGLTALLVVLMRRHTELGLRRRVHLGL